MKGKKQLSKEHSPTGDHKGRYMSGHGKMVTAQGLLTNWTMEGGPSQGTEGKQQNKGHLPTGDHKGRDKSGHRKKMTK